MNQLIPDPFEKFGINTPLIPQATLEIYQYIDDLLGRKQKDTNVNRASSAPGCYLKRWYQRNGFEGETLTPRVIVNFTLGDLTEHVVKFFILKGCVGSGRLYSEVDFGKEVGRFTIQNGKEILIYDQEDLTAYVGNILVTAHVDGWGKRNSDGKWELIEVKSAADFGFEDFKESGPGDYLKQAMVNLRTDRAIALGADSVRFFYLKKNTGHIWDRSFPFDNELFHQIVNEFKLANQEAKPEIPYPPIEETFRSKPTGRRVLGWRCGYCSFRGLCFNNLSLEFKSGKPKWIVK